MTTPSFSLNPAITSIVLGQPYLLSQLFLFDPGTAPFMALGVELIPEPGVTYNADDSGVARYAVTGESQLTSGIGGTWADWSSATVTFTSTPTFASIAALDFGFQYIYQNSPNNPGESVASVDEGVFSWPIASAAPSISIANAPPVIEGTTGPLFAAFPVTLNAAATDTITVNYVTKDGTAKAGTDYTAESGTVTFAAGQTASTINVPITQESIAAEKTFNVVLSDPVDASGGSTPTILNNTGIGTIEPGPHLFTASADAVDFNNLNADQVSAVTAGLDLYNSLDGNDIVTLPSVANYQLTSGVTFDPLHVFTTGNGNDVVNGFDGDYRIKLGNGTDVVTIGGNSVTAGGNGSSTITLGSGIDTINITGDGKNTFISGGGQAIIAVAGTGTDTFQGDLTGSAHVAGGETLMVTGTFNADATIDADSTLELGGSATGNISFSGAGGALRLDSSSIANASIGGFVESDKIDLATVGLDGLNYQPANWTSSGLTIGATSLNVSQPQTNDLAFAYDGRGGTEFTGTGFGVDGASEAGLVLDATKSLLQSIVAIKQFSGGLTLDDFKKVFDPFFGALNIAVVGAEASAIYQKWQDAVSSPDATPQQVLDAWHTAFTGAVELGVKEGLKDVLAAVADIAASAAVNVGLETIAGFAAEGAVGEYAAALAIGAGVLSVPVVVGIGAGFAAGIAFDKFYDAYWKASVDDWIETKVLPTVDQAVGVTLDGYLSSATVFADANGNGTLDPGEASATTDSTGAYVLAGGSGPLIAFGGTDTTTGLPFKGQLSAPTGSTAISPLTTLLNDLHSDPAAHQKIVASFGLTQSLDLTTLDPIAAATAGDMTGAAAQVAGAKVYDTVSLIASALAATGGTFGTSLQDAFSALASALDGAGISLIDTAAVASLINSVAQLEHITLSAGASDALASAIVASNSALDHVLQTDQSGAALLHDTAAIELVTQGAASSAVGDTLANPDQLQKVVDLYTGDNLTNLITHAQSQVQDLGQDLGPIALDGSSSTAEDTVLSGAVSAIDLNGHPITYALNGDLPAGLTFNTDGTFVFDPTVGFDHLAAGEQATTSFQYTASDGQASSNVATETITITGVANAPPIAVPDSNGVAKGSTLSVSASDGVLANDTDPDAKDQLFVSAVNGSTSNVGQSVNGTYGTLTLNADGSYDYVANKGHLPSHIVAQDTFSYTVSDGHGGTDTTSLSIVVLNHGAHYQAGIDTELRGGDGKDVLDGSAGHDVLIAGKGADVLVGGADDTLCGGKGPDTFLFRPGFGTSTVKDFDVHRDVVQFDKSMFQSVCDIVSHITDGSCGAVITDAQGDAVTLLGVHASQLTNHPHDFLLA